jgi:hypothetical protein
MLVYNLIVETVIELINANRIPSWIYKQDNETEKIGVEAETDIIKM